MLAIYRPFVERSAVSFEVDVPDVAEFAKRIDKANERWQWIVAETEGQCAGYAYGSSHRERAAYRWSVEVSAYVHDAHRRRGVGRALYLALFDVLAARGYCNAYAGITLPNPASVALHRGVGFEPVGVFRNVGWKFGVWHDVAWFQRKLRDAPPSLDEANLREARRDDIPGMHRVRLAVTENRLTSGVSEADYVPAIESAGRGWVVEVDGRVVGFVVGNATDGNIWALFVDPAHERQGHGRRLHDAMVAWLFSRGLDRLWLTTDPDTRARRFYERAGWRKVSVQEDGQVRYELRI